MLLGPASTLALLLSVSCAAGLSSARGRPPADPAAVKPSKRVSVTSVQSYRKVLAEGTPYKRLVVCGDSSPLYGDGGERRHHPVASALHARKLSGSMPGERTDGRRIALAVEGGGMRGCVSAGMVNIYAQIRAQRVGLKRT